MFELFELLINCRTFPKIKKLDLNSFFLERVFTVPGYRIFAGFSPDNAGIGVLMFQKVAKTGNIGKKDYRIPSNSFVPLIPFFFLYPNNWGLPR